MSLDKKLREILRSGALGNYVKGPDGDFVPLDWSGTPSSYFADDIAQIKQAFKDEGWVELGKDTQGKPIHVQTGKQWFERFEKELEKPQWTTTGTSERDRVLEAARKASKL